MLNLLEKAHTISKCSKQATSLSLLLRAGTSSLVAGNNVKTSNPSPSSSSTNSTSSVLFPPLFPSHSHTGAENGPTLEIIVSRMRFISSQLENKIRIVALSSSIANYKEVAEWVGATPSSTFNFHPNARPIPLEIHMQGFDMPHFGTRMMAMSRPTLYAISGQAKGKPVIVFVPNRKQASSTAKDLVAYCDMEDENKAFLKVSQEELVPHLEGIKNKALKDALLMGVGFYHEGKKKISLKKKSFWVGGNFL